VAQGIRYDDNGPYAAGGLGGPWMSVGIYDMAGGITAYGAQLHLKDPSLRIATVIETNSGWPCGSCRGIKGELTRHEVHEHHKRPEEDIVSNWLLTTFESWAMREAHFRRISDSWGFRSLDYKATDTIQGVDYTISSEKVDYSKVRFCGVNRVYTMSSEDCAQLYADAWCIKDALLSDKCVTGTAAARFDKTRTYPTDLVFCAGPNVCRSSAKWDWTETRTYKERARNCQRDSIEQGAAYDELFALPFPGSLLDRTYSQRADCSPSVLEAGAAWAVYTALHASAACGCDVVRLPFIGALGGPWRTSDRAKRLRRFAANVMRMVNNGELPDGTILAPLRRYALDVHIVVSGACYEAEQVERL
jgi:hypothetical protein